MNNNTNKGIVANIIDMHEVEEFVKTHCKNVSIANHVQSLDLEQLHSHMCRPIDSSFEAYERLAYLVLSRMGFYVCKGNAFTFLMYRLKELCSELDVDEEWRSISELILNKEPLPLLFAPLDESTFLETCKQLGFPVEEATEFPQILEPNVSESLKIYKVFFDVGPIRDAMVTYKPERIV